MDFETWLNHARGAALPGVTTDEIMDLTRGDEFAAFSSKLKMRSFDMLNSTENSMTLETMIESLSHDEKLLAMEMIWRDLSRSSASFQSPAWHEQVVKERLANPSPEPSTSLEDAKSEILARLREDRT